MIVVAAYAALGLAIVIAVSVLGYAAYVAGYRKARARHVAERAHYEADAQAQFAQLRQVVGELKTARLRAAGALGFIGRIAE